VAGTDLEVDRRAPLAEEPVDGDAVEARCEAITPAWSAGAIGLDVDPGQPRGVPGKADELLAVVILSRADDAGECRMFGLSPAVARVGPGGVVDQEQIRTVEGLEGRKLRAGMATERGEEGVSHRRRAPAATGYPPCRPFRDPLSPPSEGAPAQRSWYGTLE